MKRFTFALALVLALQASSVAQQEINTVSAEQFAQLMDGLDAYQLVDVRTVAEFEDGRIQGAALYDINNEQFENQISKLDRNRPVLLYCRTGKRSYRAAEILQEKGFRQIINLEGGITAWEAKGYDVQRDEQ